MGSQRTIRRNQFSFLPCGKKSDATGGAEPSRGQVVMAWIFPRTPMFSHDRAPKTNQNKSF